VVLASCQTVLLLWCPDAALVCSCRALGVLRKPSVGPQLVYKFAPELLAAATQETVDFLVASGEPFCPGQQLICIAAENMCNAWTVSTG
jgi:hypothetical protein